MHYSEEYKGRQGAGSVKGHDSTGVRKGAPDMAAFVSRLREDETEGTCVDWGSQVRRGESNV